MEFFLVVYFLLEFPGRGEHFYLLGVIFLPGHSQTLKGTTFFSEILLVLPFLFMPLQRCCDLLETFLLCILWGS